MSVTSAAPSTLPSPTHPPAPTAPWVDLELDWLEALVDARLDIARRNERAHQVAVRAALVPSATGLGLWMALLVR